MADPVRPQDAGMQNSQTPGAIPPKRPMTVHASKTTPKKDTSRIELSDTESPTEAPGETLTIEDALGAKLETSRIRLTEARTASEGEAVPHAKDSTARILFGDAAGEALANAGAKDGTARIFLGDAQAGSTKAYAAAKDATVRVDLTGLLEQNAAAGSEAIRLPDSNQTARIDVPSGVEAAPPKTVRLQRPAASPKTVILKRPGESSAPQTVVLRRPPVGGTDSAEIAQKTATSRISIPESAAMPAASGQRKTIMIKRSGGPTSSISRPLTFAKTAGESAGSQAQEQDMAEILASLQTQDAPGAAYGILALVAVLIMIVLVYVLAAQTLFPTLPFPGRIL